MRRLSAHVLNGLTVAIGVGCIRWLIGGLAGPLAAQLAISGAIGTSLADVPVTGRRNVRRVFLAAMLGVLAALTIEVLRPHPLALGFGIALASGLASLLTAWGTAANALAFVPVLVMIFSLATPPDTALPMHAVLWNAVGALCYLGWSALTSRLLEGRYRTLAVSEALYASARQLRARAALLGSPQDRPASDGSKLRDWVAAEAALADRLQSARDFAYTAPAGAEYQRNVGLLHHVLELRDQLLSVHLDLHLFGADAVAQAVLQRNAEAFRQLAAVLEDIADCVRKRKRDCRGPDLRIGEPAWFAGISLAADDPRARLLTIIANRQRHLRHEVEQLCAVLGGAPENVRFGRQELQRFISPEAWRLGDVRRQLEWQSPVLRHALRTAVALGSAWFIARALPWASHPHWLILSVAVVLRGNLEQTLSRRNMRIVGTLLGCMAVVVLMTLRLPWLLDLCFVLAVGVAHAFAMRRYWLAATAATVMALLQAHLVDPSASLPVAERAADTVLGALLAWGFSYVLPSWERRRLPQALMRALRNLEHYASQTLAGTGDRIFIEQRLARRRAYESLNELGTLLQRSAAEPRSVRIPDAHLALLLDHAQRFMAHLSMVRLTLTRRAADLTDGTVMPLLSETRQALADCFALRHATPGHAAATGDELQSLPAESPDEDIHPWLHRRLGLLVSESHGIRAAALALLAQGGVRRDRSDRGA